MRAESLDAVIVATDDRRIAEVVKGFGGEAVMTRKSHPSGTDRIAEAVAGRRCDLVVNLQGDEPLLDSGDVDRAVEALQGRKDCAMSTLCRPLRDPEEIARPDVVKLVRAHDGVALYFSRCPIPFVRETGTRVRHWKHLGLYVYRTEALQKIVSWPVSSLERAEKLEQLRALEGGLRILAVEAKSESVGVDRPEDVARVEALLAKRRKGQKVRRGAGQPL
jgi:3-deoxy-manno-octulosonate cytidylyltransferase (CMP-KDO synthetase)